MADIKQRKKLISTEVILLAVLAILTAWVFIWLAQVVVIEKNDLFDTAAFNYFQRWVTDTNTTIALVVTRGGSDLFLIAIYAVVLYYLRRHKLQRQAVQLVIIAGGSFLLNYLLKHLFQRPRPLILHLDYVNSYSFPSGHTQATFTLCGILAYITWQMHWATNKRLAIIIALFLYACMIGMSRIYLHVHFLSDVIGGACASLCWLAVSIIFIKLTSIENKK